MVMSSTKHSSAGMASLLNPNNGIRDQQAARGIKPKNHMAAHRQKLKQQQEEALKKRDDELNSTKGK